MSNFDLVAMLCTIAGMARQPERFGAFVVVFASCIVLTGPANGAWGAKYDVTSTKAANRATAENGRDWTVAQARSVKRRAKSGGLPQDDGEPIKSFRRSDTAGPPKRKPDFAVITSKGQGVPLEDDQSLKRLRRAADQGHPEAQNNLAALYVFGDGVLQDYVLAHMWFNLAATSGAENASNNRDGLAKLMTREQIAEAQRLARSWRPN